MHFMPREKGQCEYLNEAGDKWLQNEVKTTK